MKKIDKKQEKPASAPIISAEKETDKLIIPPEQIERERKQILEAYKIMHRAARSRLQGDDANMIKEAFEFALDAHKDMRRKSGEPYIFHPITVAEIIAEEMKLDATSIVAALLHDVVEDVETITLDDIKRIFGEQVAAIVDGVTKVQTDKYAIDLSISQQAENFRKMLLGLSSDLRVIYVKLADRLHNMRTLSSMKEEKQRKIASETIYIYAPLAHRLGLNKIKSELEDLHLKYTNRAAYDDIAKKLKDTKAGRDKFVEEFIEPLREKLTAQGFKFRIFGRPKSIYSIHNKLQAQKIAFEDIYDLFAIRVILDGEYAENERNKEKEDCWRAYSVVTDLYFPSPERLREWITQPRPNGYESLHTTVMANGGKWVEVQIRTKRMDEIAELGYAAHWKYKENGKNNVNKIKETKTDEFLRSIRELQQQNPEMSALEFVNLFRKNFHKEEVYVFSPKGKLIHLPLGATAIDFAFEIHSEVGMKCLGVKVNTRLVPLNYELHNGDQVEIITSKQAKPNADWLKYARTSKATSKIKEFLKIERRILIDKGKIELAQKFEHLKLAWDETTQTQFRLYLNYTTNANVFYEAGLGHISPKNVESFKKHLHRQEAKEEAKARRQEAAPPKELKNPNKTIKSDAIVIGDNTGLAYSFAKCCNPVSGDEVFGFVTIHEGVKIHRNACPNAVNMRANYGYRVVNAVWHTKREEQFITEIKIVGNDRIGIVRDVTQMISNDLQVNIASLNIGLANSNIFEGHIKLFVRDIEHLYALMAQIKTIEGIEKVVRFDTESELDELQ